MALARRHLYRRERAPARKKGEIRDNMAPLAMPDAHQKEIAMAIYAIGLDAKIKVGRAAGYDKLKDKYTVMGKSMETGKAQDFTIEGDAVAVAIELFRQMNGGRITEANRRTRRAAAARAG